CVHCTQGLAARALPCGTCSLVLAASGCRGRYLLAAGHEHELPIGRYKNDVHTYLSLGTVKTMSRVTHSTRH
ncbi:hypothetical protein HAX54_025054, partial [Datura stramonium]|nr:hypothetical protein [Datura stramonium]